MPSGYLLSATACQRGQSNGTLTKAPRTLRALSTCRTSKGYSGEEQKHQSAARYSSSCDVSTTVLSSYKLPEYREAERSPVALIATPDFPHAARPLIAEPSDSTISPEPCSHRTTCSRPPY